MSGLLDGIKVVSSLVALCLVIVGAWWLVGACAGVAYVGFKAVTG